MDTSEFLERGHLYVLREKGRTIYLQEKGRASEKVIDALIQTIIDKKLYQSYMQNKAYP